MPPRPVGPLLSLHHPEVAQTYYKQGLWTSETFNDALERHAKTRPNAFAIRDSSRRLTWSDFAELVRRYAGHMAAKGLAPGERVGIRLSNRVESVASFLAAARIGAVANPSLHQNYVTEDVISLLKNIGAKLLITEDNFGVDSGKTDLAEEARKIEGMRHIFRIPAGRDSGGQLDVQISEPNRSDSPDAVCYLAFTSGTTGHPKGVMHSTNTLMANARDLVRDWGHTENTILLSLSPLTHHIAWVAVSQIMDCGGELVLNDPPDGMTALEWMLETQATYVMGVPTHAMDVQAEAHRRGLEKLGNVSVFYMAGAQIPPAVADRFRTLGVLPQNVYGMSENSSHQYTLPADPDTVITNTCGRGGPAYEIKIVDQSDPDKEAKDGEIGQIAGHGACLMLGYFNNQSATEASFNRHGWFLSGDLGRIDQDGNLIVTGRLKDIIIRGGHNIHPAKVEDIAVSHPSIAKAAAFAVPDERLGEKVCLAVMPSGVEAIPEAELILEHLARGGLSHYDMPEYFLILDAFPLTASGKILKRELVEMLKRGEISPKQCRYNRPK